ncbi:Nif3-like dinuclear metal center hexameric protein [Oceanivirga salmonicida]|uniref:Nif3-like dinuclear metal center hexameric protein n=1 Tax=Oceanivirga salmonicida TaxID=1769291 RepID=UPI00082E4AC3|nr:Nif3-like dinuclear metal center hexameric protein [Oceanivirga salmonicida]
MKLNKIIKMFESKYPKNLACEWDNVGLLIGDSENEIKKVLCALDVSSKVIDYAVENNFDMIMAHHPLIFKPIKNILIDNPMGYRIIKAIKNDVAIYAAHTNLDSGINGLNDYVLSLLNLKFEYIYEEESYNKPIRFIELEHQTDIYEIVTAVKNALNVENIKLIFDDYYNSKYIKKIAIVTGSGADFIPDVISKVDLMLTADVKHHEALDALEEGLCIIDFGHHESESPSIDIIADFLEENTDVMVERYYMPSVIKIK